MSQSTVGHPATGAGARGPRLAVVALAPTAVVATAFATAFWWFGSPELFGGAVLTGLYALLVVLRAVAWPSNDPAGLNHTLGRQREITRVALGHLAWVSIAVISIAGLHSLSANYRLDATNHDRTTPLHQFGLGALSVALVLAVALLVVQRRLLAGRALTWATCLLLITALTVAIGGAGAEQAIRNEVQPCACLMP